jgi:hypothetical protein
VPLQCAFGCGFDLLVSPSLCLSVILPLPLPLPFFYCLLYRRTAVLSDSRNLRCAAISALPVIGRKMLRPYNVRSAVFRSPRLPVSLSLCHFISFALSTLLLILYEKPMVINSRNCSLGSLIFWLLASKTGLPSLSSLSKSTLVS